MLLCTVTIPLPKRCMCWLSGTKRKPGTRLARRAAPPPPSPPCRIDRKSTRLNSSHSQISYAVFCLEQKIEVAAHLHPGQLDLTGAPLRRLVETIQRIPPETGAPTPEFSSGKSEPPRQEVPAQSYVS